MEAFPIRYMLFMSELYLTGTARHNCQTFMIPSKLAQAAIDIDLSWR